MRFPKSSSSRRTRTRWVSSASRCSKSATSSFRHSTATCKHKIRPSRRQKEEGAAFVKSLQDLHTDWFRSGATWARGDTIGWVDLALAPWVVRFDLLKKHRDFKVEDVGTEFQAWAERIVDRPSVKATTSLPDDYEKVYRESTHQGSD